MTRRTRLALGLALLAPLARGADPNSFDPATFAPVSTPCTAAGMCFTTFAYNFPSSAFGTGPFGILFLPSGKVLVNSTVAPNPTYLFPGRFGTGDDGVSCPGGSVGFSAPSFQVGSFPAFHRVVDLVMTFDGRLFATAQDAADTSGQLFEFAWTGSTFATVAVRCTGGTPAGGMALDPVSGMLVYVRDNTLRIFDPFTNSCLSPAVTLPPYTQLDGITVEADGSAIYVADVGRDQVLIVTPVRRLPFGEITALRGRVFGTGVSTPDGIALGLPGTCLENQVITNNVTGGLSVRSRDGTGPFGEMAHSNSRGDFCKANCDNGWLYATRTSSIAIVRESGGGPLVECGQGCASLVAFAQQLDASCLPGERLSDIARKCAQCADPKKKENCHPLDGEINKICAAISSGQLTGGCAARARALAVKIAFKVQAVTGEPAASVIARNSCAGAGIAVPPLP